MVDSGGVVDVFDVRRVRRVESGCFREEFGGIFQLLEPNLAIVTRRKIRQLKLAKENNWRNGFWRRRKVAGEGFGAAAIRSAVAGLSSSIVGDALKSVIMKILSAWLGVTRG